MKVNSLILFLIILSVFYYYNTLKSEKFEFTDINLFNIDTLNTAIVDLYYTSDKNSELFINKVVTNLNKNKEKIFTDKEMSIINYSENDNAIKKFKIPNVDKIMIVSILTEGLKNDDTTRFLNIHNNGMTIEKKYNDIIIKDANVVNLGGEFPSEKIEDKMLGRIFINYY
jgi:hypothetical protein